MDNKLIGICGGSGSGKTTLANGLLSQFGKEASLISMDDFYLPIEKQLLDENQMPNFDLPTAINSKIFLEYLTALKAGKSVLVDQYSFNNPNATPIEIAIHPSKYIITEGIFLFQEKGVIDLLDLMIFVDTKEDLMFDRRIKRDLENRGIPKETIQYQWKNHFVPAYTKFIYPTIAKADFVIDGNKGFEIEELGLDIKKALSV